MSDLAETLRENAQELSRRANARMYENPFWEARYGERGRIHARADGVHHVEHLAEAVGWEMPSVMIHYAQWLRPILVTRGMCTRHLADTFTALAQVIAEEGIDDSGMAAEYLRAAREALVYPTGPAGTLQRRARVLADSAAAVLYRRHPAWEERWGSSGRERCVDDLLYHLSYLADATAMHRPDLFVDYVAWVTRFLEQQGVPGAHMREALDALAGEIASHGNEMRAVSSILIAARSAGEDRQ